MIPDPLCVQGNLLYPPPQEVTSDGRPYGITYNDYSFIGWAMKQQLVWVEHQSQDIDTPGWRRTDAEDFSNALMLAMTGEMCSCDPYASVINRLLRARVLE